MQRTTSLRSGRALAVTTLIAAVVMVLLCLGLMAWFATPAQADGAVIRVPADYDTIQAAIDAAQPGDTIQVAAEDDQEQPLSYNENLVISKTLTIVGGFDRQYAPVEGSRTKVIANSQGRGVTIVPATTGVRVRLEHLTIEDGNATGLGGITPITLGMTAMLPPVDGVDGANANAAVVGDGTQIAEWQATRLPALKALVAADGFPGGPAAAQEALARLDWLAAAAELGAAMMNSIAEDTPAGPVEAQGAAEADCGGGLYSRGAAVELLDIEIAGSEASEASVGYGGGACIVDAPPDGVDIVDTWFHDNAASTKGEGYGGGLWLQNTSGVQIRDSEFQDNYASYASGDGFGGGFAVYAVNDLSLQGGSVHGNLAARTGSGAGGGGIIVQGEGVTLTGATIDGNAASQSPRDAAGGEAVGTGGGLLLDRVDDASIVTVTFDSNVGALAGEGWGGGLAVVNNSRVAIAHSTFQRNAAILGARMGIGGALSIQRSSHASLGSNLFYANVASSSLSGLGNAGAVWIDGSQDVLLLANRFEANTATLGGIGGPGALLLTKLEQVLVDGNHFDRNWANAYGLEANGGGATLALTEWLTFTNNVIVDNIAAVQQSPGGAEYAMATGGGVIMRGIADAVISGNVISGNIAALYGSPPGSSAIEAGGLLIAEGVASNNRVDSARVLVADNDIVGNIALLNGPPPNPQNGVAGSGEGGGISAAALGFRITGNRIERNAACVNSCSLSRGSAIHVMGYFQSDEVTSADATLDGNWIVGNGRPADESVVFVGLTDGVTVTNNVLAGNDATDGNISMMMSGALVALDGSVRIANNSLYANSGAALDLGNWNDTVALVANNAIVSHTLGINVAMTETVADLRYNLFNANGVDVSGPGTFTNTSPITAPVRFLDPAAYNLHLMPNSAAINSGDPAGIPPAPPVDIEGTVRPYGSRVDVGAYEWRGQGALLPSITK